MNRAASPEEFDQATALLSALFVFFLLGLAIDAERRHRASYQPLIPNRLPAAFTDTEGPTANPVDGFVNFLQKVLFAFAKAKRKILFGDNRGLIAQIGHIFRGLVQSSTQDHPRFSEQVAPLLLKILENPLKLIPFRGFSLGLFRSC